MTNLHKVRLPHHRRYNWGLMLRPYREKYLRPATITLLGLLLGLLIYLGELYLLERHRAVFGTLLHTPHSAAWQAGWNAREREVQYIANFGRWTDSCRNEGDCNVYVRGIGR